VTAFEIDLDVRADEESAFVPADLVPGARRGDVVTVRSGYLDVVRSGSIVDTVEDATRGTFHRLTFDR
jgi:hypothetical protein